MALLAKVFAMYNVLSCCAVYVDIPKAILDHENKIKSAFSGFD
jgi:hypothetical protein